VYSKQNSESYQAANVTAEECHLEQLTVVTTVQAAVDVMPKTGRKSLQNLNLRESISNKI
jgi:hypothetical protein